MYNFLLLLSFLLSNNYLLPRCPQPTRIIFFCSRTKYKHLLLSLLVISPFLTNFRDKTISAHIENFEPVFSKKNHTSSVCIPMRKKSSHIFHGCKMQSSFSLLTAFYKKPIQKNITFLFHICLIHNFYT